MPGEPSQSYYFGCNACGKCCNSAPRLLLPELFRHQKRFLGCLGVERRGASFELFVHGFSFASSSRCPALRVDGRCDVQDDHKPLQCTVVPLDATLPDSEQALVLAARRREARFWGADCIRAEPAPGFKELTRRLRLVDEDSTTLLAEQRRSLSVEERFWGGAVRTLLGPELARQEAPLNSVLTVSLVPVLATLAQVSPACFERVRSFCDAQQQLNVQMIDEAVARRNEADRADTGLLRRLLRANAAFLDALGRQPPPQRSRDARTLETEQWLGASGSA